jgi:predicted nucleic acid-binding protein
LQRFVLDASILIDLKRANKLRRLSRPIAQGRIVVPLYVLKRLRKHPRWREWIRRNERSVKEGLLLPEEHAVFQELVRKHGLESSSPWLAPDDIMAVTIAACRRFPLAMRDRHAEDVAQARGVRVLKMDQLLNELAGHPPVRLL